MNLKNKVIVITGGSKGLGKELARFLVLEKAKVIISARSKNELLKASQETGALTCLCDVSKENEVNKLAAFALKKFGKIDIWINNAGITIPHMDVEDINPKSAHEVMEINFFGTFYGSRAALKIMKKQKGGTILNIVSMSSLIGRAQSSVYAASKWAARGFTESLRIALEPYNISVLMVHPGGFKTTIFGKFKPAGYKTWMEIDYVAKKIIQNLKKKSPKKEIIVNK
ncbi:MAG: SDR family oxidoreductase [Candidatus Komeilibacteria bacterium]|nr:SDR family oxidoreductase [Candidatus Komeilibacteria bacterium]